MLFAPLVLDLQRDGVSADGARKFLAGEEVFDFNDRYRLAQIMNQALGLAGGAVLLLPAIHKIREIVRENGYEVGIGLQPFGAQQFFSGQLVSNAEDRRCLAAALLRYIHQQRGRWRVEDD